ncbi:MAG: tetratricopeptide repeat protein [Bryobacterales bacterium]|nr:tetratricopeptide repeat protein [Bryobacterales bacterium]
MPPRKAISLLVAICLGIATPLPAQQASASSGTSQAAVQRAYAAIAGGYLTEAVEAFRDAVAAIPDDPRLRKDFAYALLKTGETEAARDQFAEVVRLAPADSHSALEYAFLCHESGKQPEAWELFRKLRNATNLEHRATARDTFKRIDAELRATIQRIEAALAQNPGDDSSHLELAGAYAVRNEFAQAARHFEEAFRLKPGIPERLLQLANAAEKAGDQEKARAAILLASRAPSAYVAEQARALLPHRYPYLYEFQNALALQPSHAALRREMAYFLLSLDRGNEATVAFRQVLVANPADALASAQLGFLLHEAGEREEALPLLRAAMQSEDAALRQRVREVLGEESASPPANARHLSPEPQPAPPPVYIVPMQPAPEAPGLQAATPTAELTTQTQAAAAREMGSKSYSNGYLPDAIRYYRQAHELDPTDFDTILRLAYSLNMANQDQEALQWFFLAARSPDAQVAAEATKALRNLTAPAASGAAQASSAPPSSGLVASFWAMPMHSTRWGSTFAYSQAKAELQFPEWPVVPYVSVRFVGDTTGAVGQANPQFLSENAFILGGGLRTKPRNGFLFWAEAGGAMAYLGSQRNQAASFAPDYRTGLSQFKLVGASLLAKRAGWFAETMNDLVYIHRFNRDTLAISRNRIGHHFGSKVGLGGLQLQLFLNLNANMDFKREAWANFVETGPGIRFRWAWMPPSVSFTFSTLRGYHPIARSDGRPNTYTDLQAGLWYAYTR